MRLFLTLFLCFPFFMFSQLKGKVVKVKDGDTIVILDDNLTQFTIRVADIDCPEKGQPYSLKAKQFVISEIIGKSVEIKQKNIDRYGRVIGMVLYGSKNLSHELLKNGLAWHYKYFSKDQYLAEIENKAKKNGVGLWIDPNPINPYEYRKSKKKH